MNKPPKQTPTTSEDRNAFLATCETIYDRNRVTLTPAEELICDLVRTYSAKESLTPEDVETSLKEFHESLQLLEPNKPTVRASVSIAEPSENARRYALKELEEFWGPFKANATLADALLLTWVLREWEMRKRVDADPLPGAMACSLGLVPITAELEDNVLQERKKAVGA